MIRRHSQNLRPPTRDEKEASILAVRLKEALERAKARQAETAQ